MTPEDFKERRGEPVLITHGSDGKLLERPLPATIEWGNDSIGYSLYSERDGRSCGRFANMKAEWMQRDPGADRPVWRSITRG